VPMHLPVGIVYYCYIVYDILLLYYAGSSPGLFNRSVCVKTRYTWQGKSENEIKVY
jgi:hypothetical protein